MQGYALPVNALKWTPRTLAALAGIVTSLRGLKDGGATLTVVTSGKYQPGDKYGL